MKTKAAKVNKSAAIREYLSNDPGSSAGDVVTGLKLKGIKVVPNQVYGIKAELAKRKAPTSKNGNGKPHQNGVKPMAFTVGTAPSATTWTRVVSHGPSDALSLIVRVKELADDCGGFSKLKELVDVLAG